MTENRRAVSAPLNIVDESFDIKNSDEYHLSVLFDDNAFSYSILDTPRKKYITLYTSLPLKNEELYKNFATQIKNLPYRTISIAIATPKFTIVPSPLFDEGKKIELLQFCHNLTNNELVCYNHIHNLNAKNIFSVSKTANDFIHKNFSNHKLIHSTSPFIEGLLLENKNNSEKKVYANFHSSYFELAIIEERKVIFCNAFKYQSSEDIAYSILFVYEQLELNPEEIPIVLSGLIDKKSAEHILLFNYVKNIDFAKLPENFKYSYKIDTIQPHTYFSLFNQYICE